MVFLHLLRPKGFHLNLLAFGEFLGNERDGCCRAKVDVKRFALGTFHEKMRPHECPTCRVLAWAGFYFDDRALEGHCLWKIDRPCHAFRAAHTALRHSCRRQ